MSLDKEKIYYYAPTQLAGNRYLPNDLKSNTDIRAYGQDFGAMFTLPSTLRSTSIIMVNGIRFCDRLLVYLACLSGCKVIIIQHGRNEYFQVLDILSTFKKLISSSRYCREAIFLLFVSIQIIARRVFYKDRSSNAFCKLYYFTDDYNKSWSERLSQRNVNYLSSQVKPPNPLTWGTVVPIPRVDYLSCFLVDEPLDVTLGLSDDDFFKILNDFLEDMSIDQIFVKKHPRSHVDKFREHERFIEVDSIPLRTKNLIGYKSNLLYCGISADKFFQVSRSGIIESMLVNSDDNKNGDSTSYNDISVEEFLCNLV